MSILVDSSNIFIFTTSKMSVLSSFNKVSIPENTVVFPVGSFLRDDDLYPNTYFAVSYPYIALTKRDWTASNIVMFIAPKSLKERLKEYLRNNFTPMQDSFKVCKPTYNEPPACPHNFVMISPKSMTFRIPDDDYFRQPFFEQKATITLLFIKFNENIDNYAGFLARYIDFNFLTTNNDQDIQRRIKCL